MSFRRQPALRPGRRSRADRLGSSPGPRGPGFPLSPQLGLTRFAPWTILSPRRAGATRPPGPPSQEQPRTTDPRRRFRPGTKRRLPMRRERLEYGGWGLGAGSIAWAVRKKRTDGQREIGVRGRGLVLLSSFRAEARSAADPEPSGAREREPVADIALTVHIEVADGSPRFAAAPLGTGSSLRYARNDERRPRLRSANRDAWHERRRCLDRRP